MQSATPSEAGPGVVLPVAGPASPRVGAGTVLAIGTWIGLVVGFCDVGLLVLNKKFILKDFYRLSGDFPWIVILAVTVLVLAPALVIALARGFGGRCRWRCQWGCCRSSGSLS